MLRLRKSILLLVTISLLTSFQQAKIKWVAIGDSITYLNDHTNETGNRVTKGYLTRVVEKLSEIEYINKGFNGWTSGNIAARIDSLGLVTADVYTIFLSTNDWWHGRSLGTLQDYKNNVGNVSVYGAYRIIVDKIRSLNKAAKIVLITPMQRGDFVYINDPKNNAYGSYKTKNNQSLEAFANAIDSIGAYEHIPVADLYHNKRLTVKNTVHFKRLRDPETGAYKRYRYPDYTTIKFTPDSDDYPYPPDAIDITYDGLHPSDKGNAIIAKELIQQFKNLHL